MRDRTRDVVGQLLASGQSCVVITVLSVRGSVPTHLGAKAVVTAAGLRADIVGGARVGAKPSLTRSSFSFRPPTA
jgi:xanthine/CO dehydrogenase XdhC/CoxF family maturation factor